MTFINHYIDWFHDIVGALSEHPKGSAIQQVL